MVRTFACYVLLCALPLEAVAEECAEPVRSKLTAVPLSFLPGWGADDLSQALPPFVASCEKLAKKSSGQRIGASPYGGTAGQWRRACNAARSVPAGDAAKARQFFEKHFAAYSIGGPGGAQGKFTGYYVQNLKGSRTRSQRYRYPVLARPKDLVAVTLDAFVEDGRGRRVWGRVKNGKLEPYPTRNEIRSRKNRVLLWVDDPVDALFTEIEGSGRVQMDDGRVVWIAFAGKNGRKFRGVGGVLRRMGELQKGQATMQGIRAWFANNPQRFHEIADQNPAKVFFEESTVQGAVGTQGVVLTPGRSLAVDRGIVPLSAPVWVDTHAPAVGKKGVIPWQRLLIAQDTGGAILGAVRGDVYFGADATARERGGRMGGSGRMWLLLPKTVQVSSDAQ